MEKLIELLNDFIPEGWSIEHGGKSIFYGGLNYNDRIIGKDFGFIKWLVENDKIDRDKMLKENGLFRKYFYDLEYVKNYDRLIMWLSVSDNLIQDLIDLLR